MVLLPFPEMHGEPHLNSHKITLKVHNVTPHLSSIQHQNLLGLCWGGGNALTFQQRVDLHQVFSCLWSFQLCLLQAGMFPAMENTAGSLLQQISDVDKEWGKYTGCGGTQRTKEGLQNTGVKPRGKRIHPHQENQTLLPHPHVGIGKCPQTLARETTIYKMKGILLLWQILSKSVTQAPKGYRDIRNAFKLFRNAH